MLKFRFGYEIPKVLNGKAKCILNLNSADIVYGGFPMVYYSSKYLVQRRPVRYGFSSRRVRNLSGPRGYEKDALYWFRTEKEAIDFFKRPDVVMVNEKAWSNIPETQNMYLPSDIIIKIND